MSRLIYVLNGPNLNKLGVLKPEIYGLVTLADIQRRCEQRAEMHGLAVDFRQTNFEGVLVESCHEALEKAAGIVINPAGLGFTSIALMDALKMFEGPTIEVHLSNPHKRETIYHNSLVSRAATAVISGLGVDGYELALDAISRRLQTKA
jgi:3-dehydroquinate dehydratase II